MINGAGLTAYDTLSALVLSRKRQETEISDRGNVMDT